MAYVAKWKKEEVGNLTKLLDDNGLIALADIRGIAAPQMQQMRAVLRERMNVRVVKNTLLKLAIENSKKDNIEELMDYIDGQVALITSQENPFQLYQTLKQRRTKAPAKGGEISPSDIVVEKGPTSFNPGPIISDLQRAGFPASIQGGKVVFRKKETIIKEGEVIPENVAKLLTKLEIYPIEVGLMPAAVYEDGLVYMPKDLDVDMDQFRADFQSAAGRAFSLALSIAYMTDVTTVPLLQKAHMEALYLAVSQGIVNSSTVTHVMGRAHSQMLSLASKVTSEGLDGDLQTMLDSSAQVSSANVTVREDVKVEENDEEDEEEEISEDDAVGGLGALFG